MSSTIRTRVFVACPYSLFPLDDYKGAFKEVEKGFSVSFIFGDDEITNDHLLRKVHDQMSSCELGLFDITGRNPNVALELGMAVGLQMKYYVLLNTSWPDTGSVQADLKGIDRINYGSNQQLIVHLSFLMKQHLPPPAEKTTSAFEGMKDRILAVLRERPGQGLARLAESLGEEKRLVQPVVRLLADDRLVKTKGERRGTKYYTADTDLRKFKGK